MKYDVIVVGAGSAGAVLASRLSEDPSVSVLLLEAGPDYPDFERLPDDLKNGWGTGADGVVVGGKHDWNLTGRASSLSSKMEVPRGRVTGGTSAINGQVFLRPIPNDFERWVGMGNDEWSYEKALPYMIKIETDLDFGGDFHGKSGPILVHRHPLGSLTDDQLAFHQACRYLGFPENPDHNLPDATGVGPYPLNNPGGVRFSTSVGYLGQSRHRLNLTIKANCTTKRIVFRENTAVGVEVESGGEIFLSEAKEIVLCAGAIASPHLLMISGVGPSDQLEKHRIPLTYNSPAVGKNLRDHPTVHTMWKPSLSFNIPNKSVGPQKVALRYKAEDSPYENDMIMVMRYNHDIGDVGALVISVGIYLAESIGEMRLQSSNISLQPYLNYDMLSTESDLRRMREGVRLADKLATSPQFSSYTDGRVEPDQETLDNDKVLDQWMLKNVTTMHHISGTCKMGPSNDAGAVVDQFGKVYGVTGLRVADVSIVPDCPRANTNIAAMTIGERVADFIKQGR